MSKPAPCLIRNTRAVTVEVAGLVIPARSAIEAQLDPQRIAELRASSGIEIEPLTGPPGAVPAPPKGA